MALRSSSGVVIGIRLKFSTMTFVTVLLKNAGQTLPLSKDLKSIAVIGPTADDPYVLVGNYNGTP